MLKTTEIIILLLTSSIISFFVLKKLSKFLRKYFLKNPNKRDSHKIPTPTSGGIIFLIASYIMIFYEGFNNTEISNLILLSTPIAIIGILDDRFEISRLLRYIVQLFTAISIIYNSNINLNLEITNNYLMNSLFNILICFFLIIFFTAIINFVNFMDGIDGLVGGVMVVVFSFIALNGFPVLWILIGTMIAFLVLNWHPSKVFMGDVGSTFIASLFIGLISISDSFDLAFEFLLISTPLLADAFFCVLRRFKAKKNIFSPHRDHLYQRLNRSGWSHSSVSLIYIFGSLLIFFAAYFYGPTVSIFISLLEIMAGIVLDRFFAVKFLNELNDFS